MSTHGETLAGEAAGPYASVRAHLIARKFSFRDRPRQEWFAALAQAGFPGVLTGCDYRAGLIAALNAAEIFGGFALPLSFAPSLAGAAALASPDNTAADGLLADVLAGGRPVLAALQSGAKTMAMGAGMGMTAEAAPGGGLVVSGGRIAVPDAEHAQAFVTEAKGPDGLIVFLFRADSKGVTFSSAPSHDGGTLGDFVFDNAPVPANDILARGPAAAAMLDRMRFTVQLGLGAELAGLGAALVTRAAAAHAPEAAIEDALMDVTLARAFIFGAAAYAQPCREHALELIAGARACASMAALCAARLALQTVREDSQKDAAGRLARRALVASRIYRQPEAHKLRFQSWRWGKGSDESVLQGLFAAAGGGAVGVKPSVALAEVIEADSVLRAAASHAGAAEDIVFRDHLGTAELDLFALVCADAQHQAGEDVSHRFVQAAALRVRRRLAECALTAAGTDAALANSPGQAGEVFLNVHALS
ncbi:MAG: hypothetical protein AB7F96_18770 [Beijerinckiaceae bacterium]